MSHWWKLVTVFGEGKKCAHVKLCLPVQCRSAAYSRLKWQHWRIDLKREKKKNSTLDVLIYCEKGPLRLLSQTKSASAIKIKYN